MGGRMAERRAEGVHGSVQGSRRYRHPGHVASVLEGRGRCNLDHECPECVGERLRIEPRRLFRHLAAMILEHCQAHRSGHGRF